MDIIDKAKYIINTCIDYHEPITNVELQKILYELQKFHLQVLDKPYFEEHIEAHKFGPCIPKVYYHFCGTGYMPITMRMPVLPPDADEKLFLDLFIRNYLIKPKKKYPLCEKAYTEFPNKILTLKEIKEEK